jgi:hypothetical protein
MPNAYTYVLHHRPTDLWYYGVRWANAVAPEQDLWIVYFSSSSMVKELRKEYGDDSFDVQIRKQFETGEDAYDWEQRFIARSRIKRRSNWMNGSAKFKKPRDPDLPTLPTWNPTLAVEEIFDDWSVLRMRIRHQPYSKRTLKEILRSAPKLTLSVLQENEITLYLKRHHENHPETLRRLALLPSIGDLMDEFSAAQKFSELVLELYSTQPPNHECVSSCEVCSTWKTAKEMSDRVKSRGHNNTIHTLQIEDDKCIET